MRICLDWDHTLVDDDQEWLPGALDALRWFKRSILASIFLTDLFTFYYQQLGALANLVVDLILLAVFEALIEVEHRRAERVDPTR